MQNNRIDQKAATIPRAALLTIYKSFLRPHLDNLDIIYYLLLFIPVHLIPKVLFIPVSFNSQSVINKDYQKP